MNKDRIKRVQQDRDGNIVVEIVKYNVVSCLFHSVFGFLTFIVLIGGIVSFVAGARILSIVAIVVATLLWAWTWIHSNDVLKKNVYPSVLLDYLKQSKSSVVDENTVARFDPHRDYIECLGTDGALYYFHVEFLMERLPLYAVKILTSPITNE